MNHEIGSGLRMPLPPPTEDSLCLVTGASSGTGAELARRLAARGHAVAIVARRRELLDTLADELRNAHGARVDVRPCDLADVAARAQLVKDIEADGRFVVGLCNVAGVGMFGRFHRLDAERERLTVLVNIDALFDLTTAFLPAMLSRGTGAILNVGSLAGFQPLPANVTYSRLEGVRELVLRGSARRPCGQRCVVHGAVSWARQDRLFPRGRRAEMARCRPALRVGLADRDGRKQHRWNAGRHAHGHPAVCLEGHGREPAVSRRAACRCRRCAGSSTAWSRPPIARDPPARHRPTG